MKLSPTLAAFLGMTMATSPEFDDLTAAVTENTTVDESVVTFINGLAAQIVTAAGDRAGSLALAQKLRDSAAAVSAAITANTPTPTPTPTPAP